MLQKNLRAAYNKFFKQGTGFPKFKKKGIKDSYTTNNQKGTVAVSQNTVKLPKIGHINAKFPDKINGLIKSATISHTPSGKYFVSLLVETIVNDLPTTQSNIGIDLGLTDFIVLSNGTKVANPKVFVKTASQTCARAKDFSLSVERSLKRSSEAVREPQLPKAKDQSRQGLLTR